MNFLNNRANSLAFLLWIFKMFLFWITLSLAAYGIAWRVLLNDANINIVLFELNEAAEGKSSFNILGIVEFWSLSVGFISICGGLIIQGSQQNGCQPIGRFLFWLVMGGGILCWVATSYAEPRVIADLGGESAVRFYEPIQPVHTPDAPKHPNAAPPTLREEQMLPVVSHKLSVGQVQPRPLELAGAAPMFLLGVDGHSRQWLAQNKDKLSSMHAVGLVINVNTIDELNALRAIAPELELLPAPADTLADRLGLHHYPVIINAEGISQ